MPLVVTHTFRWMYVLGGYGRPVTSGGSISSTRASMNGSISPQCPTISFSPGWRSKVPLATRRSACSPASACQPHALVARRPATAGLSPPNRTAGHAPGGGGRVQVERHVQVLEGRQQRLESLVVEERAVGAERAVNQAPPTEAEAAGGALEFRRRLPRIAGRQRGEAREAAPVAGDRPGQGVVGPAGGRDALLAGHALGGRLDVRQDLHIDPGRVHAGDPVRHRGRATAHRGAPRRAGPAGRCPEGPPARPSRSALR